MNSIIKTYKQKAVLKAISFFVLACAIVLLYGCEKDLETDYPDFFLSNSATFENTTTINAALANIYAGLRDNSPITGNTDGLSVLLGLYTDELNYFRADSQTDNTFYNHTVLPNNSGVASLWDNSYALIYGVNAIIEGLEKSPLPDDEKDNFLGEALFLRAYLHFYLAQLFGDIPYIKTTDYTVNASVSRMSLEVVYNEMEDDLITAKNLLPDMDNSGEKLRVSSGVATAMLAKLYLLTHRWDKAFEYSNNTISSGLYFWESDLNQVFLKDSPSTIWQLKPEFEGSGTKEGETFIFDFGPPYLYALTDMFMSGFETGDLRRDVWTREISDGSESWFHPYKYKQNMFEGSSTEYSILFRLSEQYLIRAEASLYLGNFQEAKNDINTIRLRAGLQPTSANSQDDILKEIMQQRRYELFTEQGNRWFDLKRTGLANQVLSPIKTGWKTTDILFPIPQKELLLNPNLNPQNSGY